MNGTTPDSDNAKARQRSYWAEDMAHTASRERSTITAAWPASSNTRKIMPEPRLVRSKTTSTLGPPQLSDARRSWSLPSKAFALTTQPDVQVGAKAMLNRFRLEVWLQALQTLSILVWNTCTCIAWIWVINWIVSYGNLFSRSPLCNQSDFEFFMGTVLIVHSVYYWIMLFAHTPVLSSFQFVDMPEDHPPPFGFYLAKLIKHTWWTYFVSFVLVVATVVAFRSTPHWIRKFTPEFYVSCLWAHLYNATTTIAVRRIFLKETVAGQKRAQIYQNQTRWQAFVYFWKVYVLTSPKLLAVIFAGIFVQVTEKYQVAGAWDFVAYSLGSLALKASIKELAKKGVVKLNVKDVRSIFVTAGLPTVLIDTQVRVMLQRMQSTSYTLVWTFGMAAIEIAIRVSKVYYTRRQILRREAALSPTGAIAPQTVRKSFLRLGERTDLINFEQWKRQILSFQIAESYANMTAEYIAIGCSTSIVFFYWNHPKYELSRLRGSSVTDDSSSLSSTRFEVPWGQAPALALQIVVELCVDYFACVLETGSGIEFHLIQRHRRFLALLFMSIATLNILISAVLYIPVK